MAFRLLLNRIGFSNPQATAFMNEGIQEPGDLSTYTHSNLKGLFKHLANREIHPPYMAQHKLQIVRHWMEKRIPLGLPIEPALFTNEVLQVWGEKMKAANDSKDTEKPAITAPPAFKKDTKWRVWKEQFQNYLGSKVGQCKAPLTFVIRPLDAPGNIDDYPDDHDQMVYITPHTGAGYNHDNGVVFDELKALLINSPAFTWIRSHDRSRNGRAAWKALLAHYEGTTEQNRIKEAAYATTFKNYYHAHQEAHYDLELYGEIVSESQKVTDFLRGITDPLCNVAKSIVMATPTYLNNFTDAALFIASTLNITLSNTISTRNISKTSTQGGKKGGNQKNGKKLTRHYTPDEWKALTDEERQKVRNARNAAKEKKNKQQQGNNNQNNQKGNKRNVAAVTGDNSAAYGDEEEIDVHEGNVVQILRQKGIASVSTDDAGDHMTSQRNTRLRINAIHTICHVPSTANNDNVRTILKTKCNSGEANSYGMAELDSRADTCCAGKDFIVLEDTNTTCEVHPYHPKYKPVTNVPVVKAATAYDYNGTTYILILNQELYFGDDMPNSLLNPNQIRSNGVTVDNCPTHLSPNKDSRLSIYFPEEDMRLPLQLNGIISFLSIRKPSKKEIETCTWLELTSDEEWDPYADTFADNESKYKPTLINYVLSRQKNTDERYLYSISTAFDTENVTSHPVFNTSAVSSTMKKGINAGNLAQLWGIGIQSAEATLSATTQKII
jgi:hypothetical protein